MQELKKVLVAGWFSAQDAHATGGDLLAMEVACEWLQSAGFTNYDVALDPPFSGGVNWREVDPKAYSHLVFVCGPFEKKRYEAIFLTRFAHCQLVGLNLSIPTPLGDWKPFDFLLERNTVRAVHPDMVFASKRGHVPVVGVCLVEDYPEGLCAITNAAIQRIVNRHEMAVVYIDTRLDVNSTHLRTPAEIESLIARVDVLLTTRLHGAVMAIKNGVPVVPIDPEAGGAKIVLQMNRIGWPFVFTADALDDEKLNDAYLYCLTPDARAKAKQCNQFALDTLEEMRQRFVKEMQPSGSVEANYKRRLSAPLEPAPWAEPFLQSKPQPSKNLVVPKVKRRLKKMAVMLLPGFVIYLGKRLR